MVFTNEDKIMVTVLRQDKGYSVQWKKRPEATQTLRAGCSKADPKKFRPAADPFPGGAGRSKFNHLEMVITFTYKPSLVKIDAHNFELSW